MSAASVYISVIVLGELQTAFKAGDREDTNIKLLNDFLDKLTVSIIGVSETIAEIYSEIQFSLRKKRKPIPMNDVWIAADVIETGAELIMYDPHFLEIPGLRVWSEL